VSGAKTSGRAERPATALGAGDLSTGKGGGYKNFFISERRLFVRLLGRWGDLSVRGDIVLGHLLEKTLLSVFNKEA
jgi:hypothetical protein